MVVSVNSDKSRDLELSVYGEKNDQTRITRKIHFCEDNYKPIKFLSRSGLNSYVWNVFD